MELLSLPRIFNRKFVCLIRNINNSRANIFTTRQNLLHIPDDDTPVEMENPYEKEKVECFFCKHKIVPDYKNVRMLSQFQSRFSGRVYGKHITGLCSRQQKLLEREILKAQHAGLMGFVTKDPRYYNDPQLFNINASYKEKIRKN